MQICRIWLQPVYDKGNQDYTDMPKGPLSGCEQSFKLLSTIQNMVLCMELLVHDYGSKIVAS